MSVYVFDKESKRNVSYITINNHNKNNNENSEDENITENGWQNTEELRNE